MEQYAFDDKNIRWRRIEGFDHFWYDVLDVDAATGVTQILFKFAANQQIVLHRHKTVNKTFVVQGEHKIYHADGRLKETRATGSYTVSPPSEDPHREGGGDQDAIVFFTIFGGDSVAYEILDDAQNIIATFSQTEFAALRDA
jgi:hypothetical protein